MAVTYGLRYFGLNRSTYYYNKNKDSNIDSGEEQKLVNKGGRPIPGSSKTTDGKTICDDQIKDYICEIIESEGLCYGYDKITIILRRKFNLIINKKKVYRLCKELNILRPQRVIKPKYPKKIAHIEAFHRLLEDECLSRYKFKNYTEAYEAVSEYMKSYNKVRIHSSLGYISPVEFYQKTLEGTVKPLVVKL